MGDRVRETKRPLIVSCPKGQWDASIQIEFLNAPVPSKDGKKLFVIGTQLRAELVRYDSKSGEFIPYLGGISAGELDFSRDGKWVAYVSYLSAYPVVSGRPDIGLCGARSNDSTTIGRVAT